MTNKPIKFELNKEVKVPLDSLKEKKQFDEASFRF